MMNDDTSSGIDPDIVAKALRRLNRFHASLFWADKYHELGSREIANRLRMPEELVASQMRIMIAMFVLAAEDVEVGRPERMTAKCNRLFGSLVWTMKLRLCAFRAGHVSRRRKSGDIRNR